MGPNLLISERFSYTYELMIVPVNQTSSGHIEVVHDYNVEGLN
jgi:hypothetical protein